METKNVILGAAATVAGVALFRSPQGKQIIEGFMGWLTKGGGKAALETARSRASTFASTPAGSQLTAFFKDSAQTAGSHAISKGVPRVGTTLMQKVKSHPGLVGAGGAGAATAASASGDDDGGRDQQAGPLSSV